jgi:putative tryptophan/tyrosine transport system substrate-binding protein
MRRREFITLFGSAAAAWPVAARAQQPATPVIGFLSARSPEDSTDPLAGFRRGLREGGFVEGQNVAIEFRWANGDYGRLPQMAAELVRRQVNVIAAVGGELSGSAAKGATKMIPIAFATGSDPIKGGLVESFNRPGGNATGITTLTNLMEAKRLGLLRELAPKAEVIGVLTNPNFPASVVQLRDVEAAAPALGRRLVVAKASSDAELEDAFSRLLGERAEALLVGADPYFDVRRSHIVAFAAEHRLPAIYQFRDFAAVGGLLSYGVDFRETYRQVGLYTAKLLKGANPAELPVQQIDKFELVINMKTAKAQGIVISDNLLSLADELIE